MTDPNRVAGYMEISHNGTKLSAAGSFSWNLGLPKRTEILGPDKLHGYSEMPQAPYIEGAIIVTSGTSVTEICSVTNASVVLTTATGKMISLGDAFYAGEGVGETEGGTLQVRFVGMRGQEV